MADLNLFQFNDTGTGEFATVQNLELFTLTVDLVSGLDTTLLTWSVAKISDTLVRVTFGRNLRSLAATTNAANYVITGPTVISVSSVSFTPGTSIVDLNVSGVFATAGGTYTLTMAANTAQALADDYFNTTVPQTFISAATSSGGGSSRLNAGIN